MCKCALTYERQLLSLSACNNKTTITKTIKATVTTIIVTITIIITFLRTKFTRQNVMKKFVHILNRVYSFGMKHFSFIEAPIMVSFRHSCKVIANNLYFPCLRNAVIDYGEMWQEPVPPPFVFPLHFTSLYSPPVLQLLAGSYKLC